MMISEALELYVNGGRFSHSLCMCVVGHDYCGLGGDKDWSWWMSCMRDKAKGVGYMSGDAGAFPKCKVIHR